MNTRCVVAKCEAEERDLTGLWGRPVCYPHLADYQLWPKSPKDRAPTREEWAEFISSLKQHTEAA